MTHPNIVFVFSDQQRYSAVGCSGNPFVQTPSFDRLAKEGVRSGMLCLDQRFSNSKWETGP